ncbi:ABC transporter permease [Pseudonocardia sp. MH-G8]|uniref:ABC transporter permease n=1 Tax=Pseudonocardia sp. MH-G8 TaxID=1854588 RepID=UPI000BA1015C|nr:ABC transporter permease [Pseudonocardia sp. MH-G8]OZM77940.1 ribose ABC transporter permease [Pseudonocardia sp. MH-G8]
MSTAALIDEDGAAPGPGRRPRSGSLTRMAPRIGLLVLLVVLLGLLVPDFLSVGNLLNVLQQVSIIGVVSVGMVFVVLTGGIDLSVGSILATSGVVFGLAVLGDVPPPLALLLAVLVGGLFGLVNGVGVTVLGIQPFVMTLATLAIGGGLALTVSGGSGVVFTREDALVDFFGSGGIGAVPGQFIVFAATALLGWLTLTYLPFGRYIYAVGGSREAARLSGIRVNRVLLAVYVIAGSCAGLAGMMTASLVQSGEPTAGGLTNLQAIAAVVIGGISLFGGRGHLLGAVVGAFVLAVIANVLVLLGISPYQAQIVQGVVIIAAVLVASGEIRTAVRRLLRRSTAGAPR